MPPVKIRIAGSNYDLYPDRIVDPLDPSACYLAAKAVINLRAEEALRVSPAQFNHWRALDDAILATTRGAWCARVEGIVTAAIALVEATQGATPGKLLRSKCLAPELAALREAVEFCGDAVDEFKDHCEALGDLERAAREFEHDMYEEPVDPIDLEVLDP